MRRLSNTCLSLLAHPELSRAEEPTAGVVGVPRLEVGAPNCCAKAMIAAAAAGATAMTTTFERDTTCVTGLSALAVAALTHGVTPLGAVT